MQLSEHFSLAEMIFSEAGTRHNIDNYPDMLTMDNLKRTAAGMELVRAALGYPIHVTSGYRCLTINAIVGGAPTSAHTLGWACDFVCPNFGTPFAVCKLLEDFGIKFDQLIHEYGTWTHISFDPRMRQQKLTIGHNTGGYKQGILRL